MDFCSLTCWVVMVTVIIVIIIVPLLPPLLPSPLVLLLVLFFCLYCCLNEECTQPLPFVPDSLNFDRFSCWWFQLFFFNMIELLYFNICLVVFCLQVLSSFAGFLNHVIEFLFCTTALLLTSWNYFLSLFIPCLFHL